MTKDDKLLLLFDFYMFYVVGGGDHLMEEHCPFGKWGQSSECESLCYSLFPVYRYLRGEGGLDLPGCPEDVFEDSGAAIHDLLVSEGFVTHD